MDKFSSHTGVGVPLRRSNVDTDQIIPAVYLKRVTRTGFEDGLFSAWRNDPAFVLNHPPYDKGSVLVAGPDFGTGDEHRAGGVRLVVEDERRVVAPGREQAVLEAVAGDSLQVDGGDDLVGVDVAALERHRDTRVCAELLHDSDLRADEVSR